MELNMSKEEIENEISMLDAHVEKMIIKKQAVQMESELYEEDDQTDFIHDTKVLEKDIKRCVKRLNVLEDQLMRYE